MKGDNTIVDRVFVFETEVLVLGFKSTQLYNKILLDMERISCVETNNPQTLLVSHEDISNRRIYKLNPKFFIASYYGQDKLDPAEISNPDNVVVLTITLLSGVPITIPICGIKRAINVIDQIHDKINDSKYIGFLSILQDHVRYAIINMGYLIGKVLSITITPCK